MANDKKRDPIPKHFKSIQEAAEFWDSHDLVDYEDLFVRLTLMWISKGVYF